MEGSAVSDIKETHKRYLTDGSNHVFWPITAVDAIEGLTGSFLYQQIKGHLDWSDINNKPKLESPDGSKWQPMIDNDGAVTWKKVIDGE